MICINIYSIYVAYNDQLTYKIILWTIHYQQMDLMSSLAFEIMLNHIFSFITSCDWFLCFYTTNKWLQALIVVAQTTLLKHSWSGCLVGTRVQMNRTNRTNMPEFVLTKPNRFAVNGTIRWEDWGHSCRKRETGKPYITIEKQGNRCFIRCLIKLLDMFLFNVCKNKTATQTEPC